MTDPGTNGTPATAVVVPLRSFRRAKERLSPALEPDEREVLVRRLAERVLAAAGDRAVLVVSPDAEVRRWATHLGATAVADSGDGLDAAVRSGVEAAGKAGFDRVAVVAADLPLVDRLPDTNHRGTSLAPDRHGQGTNLCVVPAHAGFRFAYGPGSFHRHLAEADRLGLLVHVLDDESLAFDLDVPEDLRDLRRRHPQTARELGLEP